MSSNGLWKVIPQQPSSITEMALNLSSEDSSLCSPPTSQDEPIDFSQKSESNIPSDTSLSQDGGIRKKFKTENGTVHQNGHSRNGYPIDNRRGIQFDPYYHPNFLEQFQRKQDGIEGNIDGSAEGFHPQIGYSSPKIENGNPSTYLAAIRSPTSFPQSDVTSSRTSPRSHEANAHRANLSSSSPETDSNMTNGRSWLGSPEAKVNNMGVCNGEGVISPQMNGPIPNFMGPSTSSGVTHFPGPSTSSGVTHFMGKNASFSPPGMFRSFSSFRHSTMPIMNPMNVKKSNGSSPGTSTATEAVPYHVAFPPSSTSYDDPSRAVQLPNQWQLGSYLQHSILQSHLEDKKSTKQVRPFKAYSGEIIKTFFPGIMADSMGMGSSVNYKHRSEYIHQMTKNASRGEVDSNNGNVSELPTTSDVTKFDCQSTTANGCGETSSSPEMKGNESNSSSSPQNDESGQQSSDNGSGRRRGKRYPETEKDQAYWERRKKNNEAAKRSRDNRRMQEDRLATTAKSLMEINHGLNVNLGYKESNIKKLEEEIKSLKEKEATLMKYAYRLQIRCRDCSICSTSNPEELPV